MIWQALTFLAIHLLVTKIGFIYSDLKVVSIGNEQLLDKLDEGVIILDSSSLEVLFSNKSAKKVQISDLDFEKPLFAFLDSEFFK